jgi:hypothetical protein
MTQPHNVSGSMRVTILRGALLRKAPHDEAELKIASS